jgi:flagellar protein FliO/FliZ
MSSSPDIWVAFGRTFSMLFLVLALLILVFYLIKKYSNAKGLKGSKNFINVLTVHHLSPKEKLVLVDVLGDTILIGVTSSNITKISSFDKKVILSAETEEQSSKFSDYLSQKLSRSTPLKEKELIIKGKEK